MSVPLQGRGRGARSSQLRDHNARAILTLLRDGPLSGKDLAARLGLSAQTASVITRDLAAERLILRGAPVRGKVGKPQVPWALNPAGAFSVGMRVGRRSAEFVLMDMVGQPRHQEQLRYSVPTPEVIERFLARQLDHALKAVGPDAERLTGIGVAAPTALWSWTEGFAPEPAALEAWRDYSFPDAFARLTDLPVSVSNDGTMSCRGEMLFGAGRGLSEFAHVHIGALLGGGVVLNGRVYDGAHGNAGDFGAIPVRGRRLSSVASLAQLEARLAEAEGVPVSLGARPELWEAHPEKVSEWVHQSAAAIAEATLALRAVLDVPWVIIDGGMPEAVKAKLVAEVAVRQQELDQRGLCKTEILAGQLGSRAGAMGAATLPMVTAHFLDGELPA